MAFALLDGLFVVMLLSGVFLAFLGWDSYTRWDEPGLQAFVVFCGVVGLFGFLTGGVGLLQSQGILAGPAQNPYWRWPVLFQFALYLSVIPWTLFALQYSGRLAETTSPVLALLAVPPVVGLGVFFASRFVVGNDPNSLAFNLVSPLATITQIYIYGMLFVGAYVLLQTTSVYGHLSVVQGAALTLAGYALWVPNTVQANIVLLSSETAAVGVIAAGFATCALAIPVALVRYDTFEATPAVGSIGQRAVSREIDDLIVVTDHRERVIELNQAVEQTLDVDHDMPLGEPLGDLLGYDVATLQSLGTVELHTTEGQREFDPQVSELTDQHGRWLGHLLSLRDVTERRIRQQRLEVLNRVLRHNLRNKLTVVVGNAQTVEAGADDPERFAGAIVDASRDLMGLSERAKTVEEYLHQDAEDVTEFDVRVLLEDVAADLESEFPDADFAVDAPDGLSIAARRGLLFHVVENAADNAARHNDGDEPSVTLRAETRDGSAHPIHIAVSDDGPGIPQHEVDVIRAGEETALEHGSGLGLWVLSWGVRHIGGNLSFERDDPDGTTVHIDLPHQPITASTDTEAPRQPAVDGDD